MKAHMQLDVITTAPMRMPKAALAVVAAAFAVSCLLFLTGCGESEPPAEFFHTRMQPLTATDRPLSEADLAEIAAVEQQRELEAKLEEAKAALATGAAETVIDPSALGLLNVDDYFTISPLSDEVFARIQGTTYKDNCPVSRDNLRYLRLLHVNAEGETKIGEMITNVSIAEDVRDIFRELYHASYPIERIRLQDDFGGGDDEANMEANNTSCFNCRPIEGTNQISLHGYGVAVDVNTLYNPYYMRSSDTVLPVTAREYIDRSIVTAYTITKGDLCHSLFTQHGFTWGGTWSDPDYQHFEKN